MGTVDHRDKQNQGIRERHRINNPVRKRLYTLKEAAEYLGRSEWGMRELIWSGKIPVVRGEGGRKIFLDIVDLENFIAGSKSTYP